MNSRERFIAACRAKRTDRPPVWFMRQAGRCLPEYRELRKKHTFATLVKTPGLAAEVTLQPIRRLGFDAAIIFSDILVVSEALGYPYAFDDKSGMKLTRTISSPKEIAAMEPRSAAESLEYVSAAIRIVRREIGDATALIGFAPSPWTLACYMLEGGGSSEFHRIRTLIRDDRKLVDLLMAKITTATVLYLKEQIRAGCDAVQLFDSLGGMLPSSRFDEMSGRWMKRLIRALKPKVPVIVFSRGVHDCWESLAATGCDVVGVDWGVSLSSVAANVPKRIALQGNLDPAVLLSSPAAARRETRAVLAELKGRPGHVFNLGHGVPPQARLDSMEAVVEAVRAFK